MSIYKVILVGESKFNLSNSTIEKIPFIEKALEFENKNGGFEEETDVDLFIDRDGDLFKQILNCIRGISCKVDFETKRSILTEMDYYCIEIKNYSGYIIEKYPPTLVSTIISDGDDLKTMLEFLGDRVDTITEIEPEIKTRYSLTDIISIFRGVNVDMTDMSVLHDIMMVNGILPKWKITYFTTGGKKR
jgi:hypothetical protein